ncbi:MAG: caspase family protein [Nitrospira sp.]|nr:caspase family protein [Nitrospira sp.]
MHATWFSRNHLQQELPFCRQLITGSAEQFHDMETACKNIPFSFFIAVTLMVVLSACTSDPPSVDTVKAVTGAINAPGGPETYEVVDCLLPGQIRQLGTQVTYVTERRPVRTTTEDCAIRGGEYVARDRADYGTSLKFWLSEAQKGSAEAQYYTATLYERGAGGEPDYQRAANWYRKAAEQGDKRAAVNLGRLYEQGLGVSKDPAQAFTWFAKASGLDDAALSLLTNQQLPNAQATTRIRELEQALATTNQEVTRLNNHLQELQRLAETDRRKSQDADQRYQAARAELDQLRERPDQSEAIAKADARVKQIQEEMDRARRELDTRNTDIVQLQQKIASFETNAIDLGFDGPTLEIIDPPLARTRSKEQLAIPINTGSQRSVTGRVLAPAGLRSLMVNGEKMKVNEDGVFTSTFGALQSPSDESVVQILAVDTQNKRAALKFVLKGKGTIQPNPQVPKQDLSEFGHYHALVIGNDHYKHWKVLKNGISDATAVAKTLKEQYGFHVTIIKDSIRSDIMNALNEYRKILNENDNLLIYYAGHGHLEQDIDRGYWIPVNAEIDNNSEWVNLSDVTDLLQLISAKHVMVVADSCFGGKLTRSSLAQLKPGLTAHARLDILKKLAKRRVRTAMTSGGVNPVLDAGGSGHSVFAEAFLGVLEENDTVLEAERLFLAIRSRVVSTSQQIHSEQIPTYDPIHMAGHESIGDFIFVPRAL